jgi:hypothetical protein
MALPVYVVTGFLDAGKTTFLNNLLRRRDWREKRIMVVQFETGQEEFSRPACDCQRLVFSQSELAQRPKRIAQEICACLQSERFDEIWLEWNGVAPFSQLEALLSDSRLLRLCRLLKVIHVADAAGIENLLGRTGPALPEQIANSDFAVLRNVRSQNAFRRIARLFTDLNPGIPVFSAIAYEELDQQLRLRERPVTSFFVTVGLLMALYFAARPVFQLLRIPVNTISNVFLGIILQAFPFLLIGVLLSAAIQIFVSQSAIERLFPKSLGRGMLAAIIGGFCLPVCDCASIPIFRSLVRKGVPLPAAVTFMTATPVINPVVILSTYYAFGGDLKMVASRVCLGIVSAVLIGLWFAILPSQGQILSGGKLDSVLCSCGCYLDSRPHTFSGKLSLFLRHSQAEFFSVGKYLLIGTFISALFQTMGKGLFASAQSGASLAISLVIMMAMAFFLSLCSSSDAVVARGFAGQFPAGALMGFLVFGPMMDLKNVLMLSAGFSKRFIGKLLFVAFSVCFAIVFLFSRLGGM